MGAPVTCGICESERKPIINAFLMNGRSAHYIEQQMRAMGHPTKAETVQKHIRRCLDGKPSNASLAEGQSAVLAGEVNVHADFAQAIRAEANKLLASGKLQVTAAHGLNAQALIDRRAEKAADRRLLVELGMLLSGARSLEGPPDDLIETEWREVDPLAPPQLVARE